MPLCCDRFAPDCTLLLDDAAHEGESAILQQWKHRFEASIEVRTPHDSAFARITVNRRGWVRDS